MLEAFKKEVQTAKKMRQEYLMNRKELILDQLRMYNHDRKNKKAKWAKAIRFQKIVQKRNFFDLLMKLTQKI